MMLKISIYAACSALGLSLLAPVALHAQQPAPDARLGTIDSPVRGSDDGQESLTPFAAIAASKTFTKAQYSSGGVGLRNLGTGTLQISGVTPPVKGAVLYWAVISDGPAKAADKSVTLIRTFPAAAHGVTLTGTLEGTGPSPCWPGNTISVFRATVPLSQATGNGSYQVAFEKAGASGSTAGEDPWLADPLPLLEGASLVVVGTGAGTVHLFDSGVSGRTFGKTKNPTTFTYTLPFAPAASGGQVLFETIGADGQIGSSRTAGNASRNQPYLALKQTVINGVIVAGPYNETYIDYDADWNGNAAAPLPRLWDDVGHDITAAAPSGTKSLKISITTNGDCLTPVANVIATF